MALAVRADHFSADDIAVFDIIELKLFRFAKMLENIPIFIRNCYFHNNKTSQEIQEQVLMTYVIYLCLSI